MSLGKEFVPCLRRSGGVAMKVNVSPIIMNRDEAIASLVEQIGWKDISYIHNLNKGKTKAQLTMAARYLSYYGYFEHQPQSREHCEEYHKDQLEVWDACAYLIDKHFPEFNYLKGE